MPKNHPKIYTKPPNSGYGYKHRDLAFRLETWASRVKRGQNVYLTCTLALKECQFLPPP